MVSTQCRRPAPTNPNPNPNTCIQVTTSDHIDAARLLLLVPKGGFLELRALLLERLDRHMDALRWLLPPVVTALLLIYAFLSGQLLRAAELYGVARSRCKLHIVTKMHIIKNWSSQLAWHHA